MTQVRLGVDLACQAAHQASLADEQGKFLWSGWKFTTTTADLEKLWAKVPDGAEVTAVMEPTRNAWVPVAAWLKAHGAKVVVVPPEQSPDLRDYYNKHTKTDRLDSRLLARLPLLHPTASGRSTTWALPSRCAVPSGTARPSKSAGHRPCSAWTP